METDERPAKMRKLAHGEDGQTGEEMAESVANGSTAPTDSSPIREQNAAAVSEDQSASESNKTIEGQESEPKISKNQLKKARRLAAWEAGRENRKIIRREKIKAKKERRRDEWARNHPEAEKSHALEGNTPANSDQTGEEDEHREKDDNETQGTDAQAKPPREVANGDKKRPKQVRERSAKKMTGTQVPITVIFDCDFEDLMFDNELKSLGLQITRCYSDNRKSSFRTHLAVSSFKGKMKERFDGILEKQYTHWTNVRFFEEDFVSVAKFSKEWMSGVEGGKIAGALSQDDAPTNDEEGEIVYLSSESENTLERLKPNGTYIIGGLVDKNRHKGLCHKRAVNRGIKTAKLPIGEFLEMKSRQVLVTNHVLEIMLKWMEFGDWGKAFMEVIPKRKGGVLKSDAESKARDETAMPSGTGEPADVDVNMRDGDETFADQVPRISEVLEEADGGTAAEDAAGIAETGNTVRVA
ncbi:guanine-1-methyltransferase-domain-containing protein [Dendryphion nanum]|uniref:tRNA (guanine(9)-N1)-methyltransferase n=1 Tax=Dendryphion nanum TaxID=256645 RepID=A0A9P9EHJ6_9PLEO|nr:guanine-1-methyltransferase-domain-containing protein [Dendryphion nanum]